MRVMTFSRYSSARSKFVAIFFWLYSMIGSRVLIVGTMTLGGIIVSESNSKEKEVSLVARRLVM